MEGELLERGMYIRCPIAEFDDPRNFIVGRIIQTDDFTENVTVAFLDPFGFRNYYENIPKKAELPYDYVKRCTLHRESYVIYRGTRYKILSALKKDEWYCQLYRQYKRILNMLHGMLKKEEAIFL